MFGKRDFSCGNILSISYFVVRAINSLSLNTRFSKFVFLVNEKVAYIYISKRFDGNYKIISNREVRAGYFELIVKIDNITRYCSPGQFFMISVPEVFLRRPISIHYVKKDSLSFLYKVVGKGTKILSKIQSGTLQLLGPLGNGYDFKNWEQSSYTVVAGGTGIASIYYLATKLTQNGILYYGARSERDLVCLDKFKKMNWKVIISTEDGSKGYKGYITDMLLKGLNDTTLLIACGPTPMLKKVIQIAKVKCIKGFVSLEEKMACGIGNCQSCAVKINGQIRMICKDGPVFRIEEVEL
ncbi:MAG: dihydroorotate dehydrogenase electron transfer subunit [Endomicrobium sp.]|nr:dihydroorotate dehydrogenase electron transfer subunit [Endomicrobium sp.]